MLSNDLDAYNLDFGFSLKDEGSLPLPRIFEKWSYVLKIGCRASARSQYGSTRLGAVLGLSVCVYVLDGEVALMFKSPLGPVMLRNFPRVLCTFTRTPNTSRTCIDAAQHNTRVTC